MAMSLEELVRLEAAPQDWIVPGWLTRGNTGFVFGQPKKACKSWLLLAAAWDLAEGKPVWGVAGFKPPQPMRTVYFAQEDTEENIKERVMAHVGAGREAANDRLWIVPKDLNIKLDTREGKGMVQKELDSVLERAGKIDLVMFDPMRRMHSGNENDSETIGKIWNVIDLIHKRYEGCATLISHHTVKPPHGKEAEGFDPTDPYTGRGSGDIYGGGDAFAVVLPGKLSSDRMERGVMVYLESKRGQQLEPAFLNVNFGTGAVTAAQATKVNLSYVTSA